MGSDTIEAYQLKEDPILSFRFVLEVQNKLTGVFLSISGISVNVESTTQTITEETKQIQRRIPGRVSYGDLQLSRGATLNDDIYEWFELLQEGDVERHNGSIVLQDGGGKEVARWDFENAWPMSISYDAFDSNNSSPINVSTTLCVESLHRVK